MKLKEYLYEANVNVSYVCVREIAPFERTNGQSP